MPRRNPKPVNRRPQPSRHNCDAKRRYTTEPEAIAVKEHQELLTMGLELRVYECPQPGCGGWHLTRRGKINDA